MERAARRDSVIERWPPVVARLSRRCRVLDQLAKESPALLARGVARRRPVSAVLGRAAGYRDEAIADAPLSTVTRRRRRGSGADVPALEVRRQSRSARLGRDIGPL